MYRLIAYPLEVFYGLCHNYAGAISLLTLSIMILLLPLTLKGTRSMLAMQKLQPEMKKLQAKHRDDRQKLNEEMMKFYRENNINPMSGCLPLLIQMPVFFVLYRTLYELLNRAPYGQDMGAAVARSASDPGGSFEKFGVFYPKHLNTSSDLYQDLHATTEMRSFGVNLAESAQKAVSSYGFGKALPFVILVLAVTATSYYQQRQIAGRNPQMAQANPQQAMLMKIMPIFFAFISLTLPAGIVVYFLVSNLFRIGQQALITRTMYSDADQPLSTTGRESDKSSTKDGAGKPKGFFSQMKEIGLPDPGRAAAEAAAAKGKGKGGAGKTGTATATKDGGTTAKNKPSAPSRGATGPSRAAPAQKNRSKNKKKRK